MAVDVLPGGVITGFGGSDAGGRLLKYDPADVHVIWGALPVTQGIVKGTFVTIERNKPSWTLIKGTDGEGTRVRTNDFSARVQLTVRRGSWVNDALSGSSRSDDLTGVFTVPLSIKDGNGRSLHFAPFAFLESPADVEYSDQEGAITWVFICDALISHTGGLDRASPAS